MGTIIETKQRPFFGDPALQGTRQGFGERFGDIVTRAALTFVVWQQRANQRHALSRLDARMLRDIGLNRAQAEQEYRKPFWQA